MLRLSFWAVPFSLRFCLLGLAFVSLLGLLCSGTLCQFIFVRLMIIGSLAANITFPFSNLERLVCEDNFPINATLPF